MVQTALFLSVACLLAYAGVAKLRSPDGTGEALRLAGLPGSVHLVRLLGTGEIVLGGTAIVLGGRPVAALLAAAYAGFAVFGARQRQRGADCGCFGTEPAPVTRIHLLVNGGASLVATAAVVRPVPGVAVLAFGDAVTMVLLLAVLGTVVALLTLVLTALPALADAVALHRPETDT